MTQPARNLEPVGSARDLCGIELRRQHWRKSSYSGGQVGGECVEVCDDFPARFPSATARTPPAPS